MGFSVPVFLAPARIPYGGSHKMASNLYPNLSYGLQLKLSGFYKMIWKKLFLSLFVSEEK